jgi:DNA-binding NarL/FixJ family response regulator
MAHEKDLRIRVVVIGDHAVVRRGLLAFLEGEPDLDVVGDAPGDEEALALVASLQAKGNSPHVVLIDLKMPPPDGLDSVRAIRASYPDVQVVAVTSFGEEHRVRAALEAGAAGYLLKDAEADEVAAAVRAAHRGKFQLDPAITRALISGLRGLPTDLAKATITRRELEVLRLVGAGRSNKEIAPLLGISERTVRGHVSKILRKLSLSSRTQAAIWAIREGLVGVGGGEGSSGPHFLRS